MSKKKIFLTFVATAGVFLLLSNISFAKHNNIEGFAWSSLYGWFSHNNKDVSLLDKDSHYGVELLADNRLTGYAWNPNLGWIQYDPVAPYPESPDFSATFDPATQDINGWAKIVSLGDDGWLKMNDIGYGVSIGCNGDFSGYAWNNAIGWIDYSKKTFTFGPKKESDGKLKGYAWTSTHGFISHSDQDTGGAAAPKTYQVTLNAGNNFEGFAWSPYLGYIDFNPTGIHPGAPSNGVRYDSSTKEVSGWAKIVEFGDDGWISFRGISGDGDPYGVTLDDEGYFNGYAWNPIIGWLDYRKGRGGVKRVGLETPLSAPQLESPVNEVDLGMSNPSTYFTPTLDFTSFPVIGPACAGSEKAYQVQVSRLNDFPDPGSPGQAVPDPLDPRWSSIMVNDTIYTTSSSAYTILAGVFDLSDPNGLAPGTDYNQTFYWRVRYQNSSDELTDWGTIARIFAPVVTPNAFKMPKHAPPLADFTYDPLEPPAFTETKFTDTSISYGGSTLVYWKWDFGDSHIIECADAGGITCTCEKAGTAVTCPAFENQHPVHVYTDDGLMTVSLLIRDSDGYEGTKVLPAPLNVTLPLPKFELGAPR